MNALTQHLEAGKELSDRQIETAAGMLLDPKADDAKKAALLEALANKGETDRVHLVLDCFLNDWLRDLILSAGAGLRPA